MWQTHQETVIFAGLNSATSIEYVQLGYGSSLCLPRGTRCRVVSKFEPHRAAGKTCQMFSPNNPNTWSAQVSSWTTAYRRPWGFGGFGGVFGGLGGFWGGGWYCSWLPALQDLLLDLLLRYPLFSCTVPCHTLSTSSCNLQDTLDFCILVS